MTLECGKDCLTSLPKEIIRQIISPLVRGDLKSLRLQNRQLNAIVSEILFRTITVQETERSIRQLSKITKCLVWARQVQIVCWLLPIWDIEIECEVTEELDLKKYYKRLRKLPNVKAIEFLNASHQLYQYQCFENASIYTLLRPAKLQVQNVLCEGTEMLLAYSSRGNLTNVTLGQSFRKPSVMIENTKEDIWQAADIDLEGCDSDDDVDNTSTISKSTELIGWVLFSRFITLDHLTLKNVKL